MSCTCVSSDTLKYYDLKLKNYIKNAVQKVQGDSAYEIAQNNGFTGTETEWLESLKGESITGPDGKTYIPHVDNDGILTWTVEGIDSGIEPVNIKGPQGTHITIESISSSDDPGGINVVTFSNNETLSIKNGLNGRDAINGKNGLSAYEIAVNNGYEGTEADWVQSLKGTDGTSISITNIEEKTGSGETSIITFSDGNTLSVKNGEDGTSPTTECNIPKGGIIMWNGSTAPDGWALCDGHWGWGGYIYDKNKWLYRTQSDVNGVIVENYYAQSNYIPQYSQKVYLTALDYQLFGEAAASSTTPSGPVNFDEWEEGGPKLLSEIEYMTPDLRNKFILGYGDKAVGSTGGEENVTLTESQIPSHSHPISIYSGGENDGSSVKSGNPSTDLGEAHTGRAGGNKDNLDTDGFPITDSHNNMPPYYVLAYIMKI